VRRRDDHGSGGGGREPVDPQAIGIDGDRDGRQPGCGELVAARGAPGILDRDPGRPARDERPCEQRHPLRHAGGHEHVPGIAGHAPHSAEVPDERTSQLGGAARIAVVEAGVGRVTQATAYRRQPTRPGEQRHVGRAGAEIEARPALHRRFDGGVGRLECSLGDARRGALAGGEVTLGDQLVVGLDHDAARDAQLARERARDGSGMPGAAARRAPPTAAAPRAAPAADPLRRGRGRAAIRSPQRRSHLNWS